MRAEFQGGIFEMEGDLNEKANFANLRKKIQEIDNIQPPESSILLDTSKVYRLNSFGIFEWVNIIQQFDRTFVFLKTPWSIIQQINITPDILGTKSYVQSFLAPFYDTIHRESFPKLVKVGVDLPILKDYESFEFENAKINGADCEPDFNPEEDFIFIALNYDRYPSNLKKDDIKGAS